MRSPFSRLVLSLVIGLLVLGQAIAHTEEPAPSAEPGEVTALVIRARALAAQLALPRAGGAALRTATDDVPATVQALRETLVALLERGATTQTLQLCDEFDALPTPVRPHRRRRLRGRVETAVSDYANFSTVTYEIVTPDRERYRLACEGGCPMLIGGTQVDASGVAIAEHLAVPAVEAGAAALQARIRLGGSGCPHTCVDAGRFWRRPAFAPRAP